MFLADCLESLKPAYGITESGRLWQLVLRNLMKENVLTEVPGLPQIFIETREKSKQLSLIFSKVFGDFLVSEDTYSRKNCHTPIPNRFTVGRFTLQNYLFFCHKTFYDLLTARSI